MVFEEFGFFVSQICSRCPLFADRPLLWTIIANSEAGGFTIKSRWKKHRLTLSQCARKAEKNPLRRNSGPSKTARSEGGATGSLGLIPSRFAGHAKEITGALIKEAAEITAGPRPFFLVITAGGDGTSRDVMSSLYHAPPEIRQNFAVLRLPMGTANDGADAFDLDKALDLIIEPSKVHYQRALRLSTASGKGPFLAFNILSAGIDAFVTHMTNKMKGKLPGDSYKLWVDIAALFYDIIFKVDYIDVRSFDGEGNEVKAFCEKLLLIAVGESGRRCYGSRKWILPDERNVCAIKQMSLIKKLILKGLLPRGTHINKPETILWNAQSVEFNARQIILAQMDGETVRLEAGDYPAIIELTEPLIPILVKS